MKIELDMFDRGYVVGIISGILGIIFLAGCYISIYPKPTAIDVYRHNTTLEITYKDSVAIDSVVVYKNIKK